MAAARVASTLRISRCPASAFRAGRLALLCLCCGGVGARCLGVPPQTRQRESPPCVRPVPAAVETHRLVGVCQGGMQCPHLAQRNGPVRVEQGVGGVARQSASVEAGRAAHRSLVEGHVAPPTQPIRSFVQWPPATVRRISARHIAAPPTRGAPPLRRRQRQSLLEGAERVRGSGGFRRRLRSLHTDNWCQVSPGHRGHDAVVVLVADVRQRVHRVHRTLRLGGALLGSTLRLGGALRPGNRTLGTLGGRDEFRGRLKLDLRGRGRVAGVEGRRKFGAGRIIRAILISSTEAGAGPSRDGSHGCVPIRTARHSHCQASRTGGFMGANRVRVVRAADGGQAGHAVVGAGVGAGVGVGSLGGGFGRARWSADGVGLVPEHLHHDGCRRTDEAGASVVLRREERDEQRRLLRRLWWDHLCVVECGDVGSAVARGGCSNGGRVRSRSSADASVCHESSLREDRRL
eukprot:scaffold1615_cov103-Isochrysis_galbana.AAC.3